MTSKEKSWHRKNQLGSRIEGWSGSRISVREKDKQAGNENHEFVMPNEPGRVSGRHQTC
jgi:hypothetical protein